MKDGLHSYIQFGDEFNRMSDDIVADVEAWIEKINSMRGLQQAFVIQELVAPTRKLFDAIQRALQEFDEEFPKIDGTPPSLGSEAFAIAIRAAYAALRWRVGGK